MTEADWEAATDPAAMLFGHFGLRAERKLRLLAAACVRQVWGRLLDPRSRNAVEDAERWADDPAAEFDPRPAWDARRAARGEAE
jgi:hypothetical protein